MVEFGASLGRHGILPPWFRYEPAPWSSYDRAGDFSVVESRICSFHAASATHAIGMESPAFFNMVGALIIHCAGGARCFDCAVGGIHACEHAILYPLFRMRGTGLRDIQAPARLGAGWCGLPHALYVGNSARVASCNTAVLGGTTENVHLQDLDNGMHLPDRVAVV